jgi:hypothetical protein
VSTLYTHSPASLLAVTDRALISGQESADGVRGPVPDSPPVEPADAGG